MPITRTACAAAVLALTLPLAACSSGADSRKESGEKQPSAAATSQSAEQRLAAVKKVMDASPSMHLKLTSKGIPDTANGVLDGEGTGTKQPGFKGDLTAKLSSIQAKVPVIAVDNKVWAKLPIWSEMRTIDPKTYGAPDPARLFTTDNGISSLLPKTKNPKFGTERRDGGDVVRPVTGTLTGPDVVGVMSLGNPSGNYTVEYLVTKNNELRRATITGAFFNDATSSYTLGLDRYGQKFNVQAPS